MKKLLLISNSTNPGEPYLDWTKKDIADFCAANHVNEALFVPYAGVTVSYDEYAAKVSKVFAEFSVKITSIHTCECPVSAVKNAQCVVVGGGNTFQLFNELQRFGIMPHLKDRVINGMPYIGWSAGSNVCCPTLKTTNDMPIVQPVSFCGLSVIPFQINPHYLDAHPQGHGGETREDRIKEFMVLNPTLYVVGLREASTLRILGDKISLLGRDKPMRVFKNGVETREYTKADDLSFLC